jgi:peptidoglycan-associated lipoprotein
MKGSVARTYLLAPGLVLTAILLTGCPKTPGVAPEANTGTGGSAQRQTAAPSRPPGAPTRTVRSNAYAATTALGDVHFNVDRAAILPGDQAVFDSNVDWLKSNAAVRLLLEGFADERGTTTHNRALGERRAAAVRDALVANGIEASRISIRSYGEDHPVCVDRTDPCWARNRRVQFLVSQ